MPKKKENAQEPATKADVQAVRTDVKVLKTDVSVLKADVKVLKTDVSVLKADVQALDQKVQAIDQKVNNIAIEVVTLKNDLKEVKENMLTKADKNEMMNFMDGLMGEVKAMRQSVLIRGDWKEGHDAKLDNHERRIQKLETSLV